LFLDLPKNFYKNYLNFKGSNDFVEINLSENGVNNWLSINYISLCNTKYFALQSRPPLDQIKFGLK